MKFRINKTQAQMLLDGKPLRNGRNLMELPKDFEDRDILERYVNDEKFRSRVTIFLDFETKALSLVVER